MVNSFWRRLSGLTLRGQCILCADRGQPGVDICLACEAELPFLGPHCRCCALPLNQLDQPLCGHCLKSPPPFSRTEAVWEYRPPIAQLIQGFKYRRRFSYGKLLATISSRKFASAYQHSATPDLITPVPLHWRRQLQRGFNQSERLAVVFARQLNLPLIKVMKRRQATSPQQQLNASQRRKNLQQAFHVTRSVNGKTIAVVDDVMTTGATARAVSDCLLAAGAADVHIWCLARTPQ